LTQDAFRAADRLNMAGRIAGEFGVLSGWATELGQVLATGNGGYLQQRAGLLGRLRGLTHIPQRLLDRLDTIDGGGGGVNSGENDSSEFGSAEFGGVREPQSLLSPSEAVEVLDEVVGAAVFGAGAYTRPLFSST
jgi:hypothetical protein